MVAAQLPHALALQLLRRLPDLVSWPVHEQTTDLGTGRLWACCAQWLPLSAGLTRCTLQQVSLAGASAARGTRHETLPIT